MKTFVMIPTYNESENIKILIDKILKLRINDLHIVVVDDNSPDGTANEVQKISKSKKNVYLLLRKSDKGRGAAGKAGFIYCLNH
ncbi:MAG: glycosyltransferase, partial [Nanoarchaeota archaeon]